MATFIDEGETPTGDEQTFEEEQVLESSSEEQTEEPQTQPEEEDEVPDKYKGKSVKDIVRMHQEAEKALGRQGSEVGELRRVVDDFIRSQTVTQQKQAPEVEEEVDFFVDPDKAIERKIANHPTVKQAEMLAAQMKKAEALANLKTAHPDFQQVIENGSFTEWVNKSRVRQELFNRADKAYDFDAANELLSTWKERNEAVVKAKEMEQISRKSAVKAASTGSAKGSGEASSKKTYRRSDIIDLMRNNPDRYMELQPEIMAAYAEGRVK